MCGYGKKTKKVFLAGFSAIEVWLHILNVETFFMKKRKVAEFCIQ